MNIAVCPICAGPLDPGVRKQCVGECKQGDRQRTIFQVVKSLSPINKNRSALIFSREVWLDTEWFKDVYFSVYKGENHLDLQDLSSLHPRKFDYVSANHILEHVPDDRLAIRQLWSVLSEDGILQLQIPAPGSHCDTFEWGYPDPKKYGHFREYGTDFSLRLKEELPDAYRVGCFAKDSLTPLRDIVWFAAKQKETALLVVRTLKKTGGYLSFVF